MSIPCPRTWILTLACVGCIGTFSGCGISVKAPEQINIANNNRPRRIDSSRVPATASHEEARQRLAECYERNRYLEKKVSRLEADKRKYKNERDEYEEKYEREKERYDD